MAKCYWCHKDKEIYAFNVCATCYRWFHRRKTNPAENCEVCGKVVMKNQKGICRPCRTVLDSASKIPKRIEVLESKYKELAPTLNEFGSSQRAFVCLEHFFKPKQKKLLEILIERYYQRNKTLDDIGKSRGVTREYIRQCENKAIEILKKALSLDDDNDEKFEDII